MITAGIDVGSLSTDVVIYHSDKGMLSYSIVPTGVNGRRAAETALEQALLSAGVSFGQVQASVATGYGRINIEFADKRVTEITCHARGIFYLYPSARTVIDIGGQDSKAIRLNSAGKVLDFVMNDKCAAGTGRFLEVMAGALEVDLAEMAELSEKTAASVPISSMCTVFAESEVVSLLAAGNAREQIIRGLHEAIADRTAGMVHRVGLEAPVAMTGGVAKNRGVVRALERKLGCPIHVPPEPQIAGALGAALLAAEN